MHNEPGEWLKKALSRLIGCNDLAVNAANAARRSNLDGLPRT